MDIPKQYPRKFPITLVQYDAIPDNADADHCQAMFTDRNGLPLDEVVIRKIDFERFINLLTTSEERYIRYKMVDEPPDRTAAAALSMSIERLYAMKATLRGKIQARVKQMTGPSYRLRLGDVAVWSFNRQGQF